MPLEYTGQTFQGWNLVGLKPFVTPLKHNYAAQTSTVVFKDEIPTYIGDVKYDSDIGYPTPPGQSLYFVGEDSNLGDYFIITEVPNRNTSDKLEIKASMGWTMYQDIIRTKKPVSKSRFDVFRFKLRMLLTKWGVI